MSNPKTLDYRAVAKELGVRYLFGRWGVNFFPDTPSGVRSWRIIRFVPLDDWITDPKEIYKEMQKRDFEL